MWYESRSDYFFVSSVAIFLMEFLQPNTRLSALADMQHQTVICDCWQWNALTELCSILSCANFFFIYLFFGKGVSASDFIWPQSLSRGQITWESKWRVDNLHKNTNIFLLVSPGKNVVPLIYIKCMYFVSISGPEHSIQYSDPLLAAWSGDRMPVRGDIFHIRLD